MNDLTHRPDLAGRPHTITVETITPELRRDSDLPAAATAAVIERHHGRLAKICNATNVDVADYVSRGYQVTMEDVAQGIAHTYGATYVPSTVVKTVPAQDGMLGYQLHALRVGAPLPGGHRILSVDDYGSDTHLGIFGSDGSIHRAHRHTEIRELTNGVVQLITPEHAGWESD
ncbi:hypothetical protein AB0K40_17895 [Nonomuraea bangladeshensis]|uniref:Uncharacterized protein n=1 Tax=Nonomuraea bangladeshensis TaxID=404385 RepID=A0ABV3H4C6_9ACTN